MNPPDKPALIDEEQWHDYRASVIAQVTATLDKLKPVAEVPWTRSTRNFTGTFDIAAGRGHHKVSVHVGPIPIFIDDDQDGDDDR